MQNISENFKQAIKQPAREITASIELDGLVLTGENITKIDIDSGLVFGEDFEIGTAPMDTCKIELIEEPDNPLIYDFEDKEADIKLGLKLPDESIEYVDMGLFTIEKAVKKDNKITLDCVDRMYKAEIDFENDLMFPTAILDILESACEQSNIELANISFANADYVVPNEPVLEDITCRHIFAQVAELAGGYARINRQGELEILTLSNNVSREITKDHYFDFKTDEVATGKIDKVIVKVGDEAAERGTGDNKYYIIDNLFVQDPNNVVQALYDVLKYVDYTSCDINFQGDFSLDLGDKIEIEGQETYILDRKLKYTGGLREDYKAPAKSNVEKNSTGKSNIILDINNIKTQIKVIEGEITQSIEKIENLVVDASNRLYQSQTQILFGFNSGIGEIQLFREAFHPYYKVTSDGNIDLSASFPASQYAENLEGEEVTISLDVLVDVDRTVTIDEKQFEVKGNRWTRIHVTKDFPENTTLNKRVRVPYSRKVTRDKVAGNKLIESLSVDINTIYYRNLQVQKGNVNTNWTLTPEELEADVNRLISEFKQVEDSISLLVKRNEDSGRFEVNTEGIIAEINKTDGVGKLKTVGVTIDENGLTVDGGAIIIRDNQNTAIITSDGLKILFAYTSSGELNGFQKIGVWNEFGDVVRREAFFSVNIPDKLTITKAELSAISMPTYKSGYSFADGYYHARNLSLYREGDMKGFIDFPYPGSYVVLYDSGGTNITNDVWGGVWSPSGGGVQEKIGDVTNILTSGKNSFIVKTSDSVGSQTNERYNGGLQFTLIVEGYLRG